MYIRSTVSASTNSVMLIEPAPFSARAFSSSGVTWTYRPFANSYPLIISSFSTFSPSFEQTYCCFRRAPSFLCSQLNEIAADDSPAENILIGTETSPKEIVAEPIECAGIGPAGERVTVRPTASGYYHWREGGAILHRPPRLPRGSLSVSNCLRPRNVQPR